MGSGIGWGCRMNLWDEPSLVLSWRQEAAEEQIEGLGAPAWPPAPPAAQEPAGRADGNSGPAVPKCEHEEIELESDSCFSPSPTTEAEVGCD